MLKSTKALDSLEKIVNLVDSTKMHNDFYLYSNTHAALGSILIEVNVREALIVLDLHLLFKLHPYF